MPKMTSYEPGTPCWVDLASPDVEVAKSFYGGLFGWHGHESPDPESGAYTMFSLPGTEGHEVAAAMPIMQEGQPPSWTAYISVTDLDATMASVVSAGGQVYLEPTDIVEQGRVGICADPMGAVFGLWQPQAFKGAGYVNDPGCFCWSELACRDITAAKAFYGAVFGWAGRTQESPGMHYTVFELAGKPIAGMVQMNEAWPAEVPPHWMIYFTVEDCDAAAAKVEELGGSVGVPPSDIPFGRFAVVSDPSGAYFSVMRPAAA
jgi:predicted enzyme related to lactoylglutathione lyase